MFFRKQAIAAISSTFKSVSTNAADSLGPPPPATSSTSPKKSSSSRPGHVLVTSPTNNDAAQVEDEYILSCDPSTSAGVPENKAPPSDFAPPPPASSPMDNDDNASVSSGGKIEFDHNAASIKGFSFTKRDSNDSAPSPKSSSKTDGNASARGAYLLEIGWTVYFLFWLIDSAWNDSAPFTSGVFFCCEFIAFISSALFHFTIIFSNNDPSNEKFHLVSSNDNDHKDGEAHESLESEEQGGTELNSSLSKDSSCTAEQEKGKEKSEDKINFQQISNKNVADVAICLCRYNEPINDLLISLQAMLEIKWPTNNKHIYILDDGFYNNCQETKESNMKAIASIVPGACDIPEDIASCFLIAKDGCVREDCAKQVLSWNIRQLDLEKGICSVTLIARMKPDVSHYKAGNINNFLYNYCGSVSSSNRKGPIVHDYLLLLDHDMIASPYILHEGVKHFLEDSENELAFVQFPQRFYDLPSNDRFYAGNQLFYDGIQPNRSNVGLAAFSGTNTIWRMSSLYHIGGFQYGSLTEDTYTSYVAHSAGFSSLYIPSNVCIGKSPQSVACAMRQRMRWSQGALEIAIQRLRIKPIDKNLNALPSSLESAYTKHTSFPRRSLWQQLVLRIIYLDSMIYPLYSIGFVLHVVTCIAYLYNLEGPMSPLNPVDILIIWIPLYVIKMIVQLLAFPRASLDSHLCAQKAWAGYAFSTLVSIKYAFKKDTNHSWFNTGATRTTTTQKTTHFYLKWGNTIFFSVIFVCMIVRLIYFATTETCRAWDTIGSLLYGSMMIFYLKDWAFEPVIEILYNQMKSKTKEETQSIVRHHWQLKDGIFSSLTSRLPESFFSTSTPVGQHPQIKYEVFNESNNSSDTKVDGPLQWVQESIELRDHYEKSTVNISLIVNSSIVLLVSVILYLWSHNGCVESYNDTTNPTVPHPPFPESFYFESDFQASSGKLFLNGEIFSIKGVNWFGFETSRNMVFGLDTVSQDEVFKFLVENGINSIRLPMAVESINNPSKHQPQAINYDLNPQYAETTDYLDTMEIFIRRASMWGIFILLDMHLLRSDTANDPFPFDERTPFDQVIHAWDTISSRMCSMWSIMGVDLKNEPHGANWAEWKYAAERMANTVIENCPQWLIFVEGIFTYESPQNPLKDYISQWGAMLTPAKEYPIQIENQNKLVYSPHVYGPGTIDSANYLVSGISLNDCRPENIQFCSDLMTNKSFPGSMYLLYDLWFGYLQEMNKTIIVGEWGGSYINQLLPHVEDNREIVRDREVKWNRSFIQYLRDNEFGSFYWSLNPESDDTGGLLLHDWTTPDTAKLDLLEKLPGTPTINIISSSLGRNSFYECLKKNKLQVFIADSGSMYEYESNGYNIEFDGSNHPSAIVFPQHEEDISHALKCSKDNKINVCVRSGGYSYTGDSLCNGMLLDMRSLNRIVKVQGMSSKFQVGGGASLGELALTLQQHGRMAPAGNHQGLGVGFFLGCGRGWWSRTFGLGCDYILSARVALNDGKIIEATDNNEHSSLLYALRGAGQGFGVVISLEIATVNLPGTKDFIYFHLQWERNQASDVFDVWQRVALQHFNPHFTCNFKLWNPLKPNVELEGAFWGTEKQLGVILKDMLDLLDTPPVSDMRKAFDYLDFVAYTTGSSDKYQLLNRNSGYSGERRSFRNKSHIIYDLLDLEGISTLLQYANEEVPGSDAYSNYIEITPLGGAITSTTHRLSSFSHRSAIAVAQYGGYWNHNSARNAMMNHQRRFRTAMEKYWGNKAFFNYKDNELNNWEDSYWNTETFQQLRDIKCKYDKPNVFSTTSQSITCDE